MVKVSFPGKRNFGDKTYKLATLHTGVTKSVATKTSKMNKLEGNKVRLIHKGKGKYACYVRKARW